jgi:hypothetical protein
MQNQIPSICIAIVIAIGYGCKEHSKEMQFKLRPLSEVEKVISIAEIADQIEYVPLDAAQNVSHILNIEASNNQYFISAGNYSGILAFDKHGKFRHQVGRVGNGPGEYRTGTIFAIDINSETLYVLNNFQILSYSFSGDHLGTISLESFGMRFDDLLIQNKKFYLFNYIDHGKSTYNWVVTDLQGKELGSKRNSIQPFETSWGGGNQLAYTFDNNIRYWNCYNDTIFTISDLDYKPFLYFEKGDFRRPLRNFPINEYTNYWNPSKISETQDFVWLLSAFKGEIMLSALRKEDGFQFLVDKTTFNDSHKQWCEFGIENDFDRGPNVVPRYIINKGGHLYLCHWFQAYQLKAHVASEAFKAATPKYPEKKLQLEQLANSLNDNDNPVLMLVKLKE